MCFIKCKAFKVSRKFAKALSYLVEESWPSFNILSVSDKISFAKLIYICFRFFGEICLFFPENYEIWARARHRHGFSITFESWPFTNHDSIWLYRAFLWSLCYARPFIAKNIGHCLVLTRVSMFWLQKFFNRLWNEPSLIPRQCIFIAFWTNTFSSVPLSIRLKMVSPKQFQGPYLTIYALLKSHSKSESKLTW